MATLLMESFPKASYNNEIPPTCLARLGNAHLSRKYVARGMLAAGHGHGTLLQVLQN